MLVIRKRLFNGYDLSLYGAGLAAVSVGGANDVGPLAPFDGVDAPS